MTSDPFIRVDIIFWWDDLRDAVGRVLRRVLRRPMSNRLRRRFARVWRRNYPELRRQIEYDMAALREVADGR